jgi:hypothetical protein
VASIRRGDALVELLARRIVTGAAMACSRDLVARALPFPSSSVHDHWLALVAACAGTLVPVDRHLLDYRVHAQNAIGLEARTPVQRIRSRFAAGDVPGREVTMLTELLDRFGTTMTVDQRALVVAALQHHRWRSDLPSSWPRRATDATRELLAGGYRGHHPSPLRSWGFDIVRPTVRH